VVQLDDRRVAGQLQQLTQQLLKALPLLAGVWLVWVLVDRELNNDHVGALHHPTHKGMINGLSTGDMCGVQLDGRLNNDSVGNSLAKTKQKIYTQEGERAKGRRCSKVQCRRQGGAGRGGRRRAEVHAS